MAKEKRRNVLIKDNPAKGEKIFFIQSRIWKRRKRIRWVGIKELMDERDYALKIAKRFGQKWDNYIVI